MKCFVCKTEIKKISSFQKKRNNRFYCSRKCYLKYVKRNKIYNFDFFDDIDTEEKTYWLGLIYVDGNLNKNGKTIQINLSAKYSDHLEKFANIFLERKKNIFDEIYKDINSRGASTYRGVSWHRTNKKWLSSISNNKKRINLGYYNNEKEAALVYNSAVLKYNKPKYKMNLLIKGGV